MAAIEVTWVHVSNEDGLTHNYYIDETFELEWQGVTCSYAVLVSEDYYEAYSLGEEVDATIHRYSLDKKTFYGIESDEEAFVTKAIADFYLNNPVS